MLVHASGSATGVGSLWLADVRATVHWPKVPVCLFCCRLALTWSCQVYIEAGENMVGPTFFNPGLVRRALVLFLLCRVPLLSRSALQGVSWVFLRPITGLMFPFAQFKVSLRFPKGM